MNTVVFILVVWTHGGWFQPGTEFTTESKCQTAANNFDSERDKRSNNIFPSMDKAKSWCWRVEK